MYREPITNNQLLESTTKKGSRYIDHAFGHTPVSSGRFKPETATTYTTFNLAFDVFLLSRSLMYVPNLTTGLRGL